MSLAALSPNFIEVFDTSKDEVVSCLQISPEKGEHGNLTWSGDGKWLIATPGHEEQCNVLALRKHTDLIKTKYNIQLPNVQSACFYRWTNRYVVTGCQNGQLAVWDVKEGNVNFEVDTQKVRSVDFVSVNSNDSHIATGCRGSNEVFLHGIHTNIMLTRLTIPMSTTTSSLYFSTCRKNYLAACSQERTVVVWDTNKGSVLLKNLNSHVGTCTDLAWSPINEFVLASVSWTKTLKLFDMREKKTIYELNIGTSGNSIEFLPRGDKIAIGTTCGDVLIYDLRDADSMLRKYKVREGPVLSLRIEVNSSSNNYKDALMSTPMEEADIEPDIKCRNMSIIDICSPIVRTEIDGESATGSTKKKFISNSSMVDEDSFLKFLSPDVHSKSRLRGEAFPCSPLTPIIKEEAEWNVSYGKTSDVNESPVGVQNSFYLETCEPEQAAVVDDVRNRNVQGCQPSLEDVMKELKEIKMEVKNIRHEFTNLIFEHNFRCKMNNAAMSYEFDKEFSLNSQRLNHIFNILEEVHQRLK